MPTRPQPAARYKAIAAYYDAENARHAMLAEDVPFFLDHLPRKRQQILELASGTGRAAIPLAQAGHAVVGVDYDAEMLAVAARKRDAVGLKERNLCLYLADALELDLGRRFDWACVFFNTFLAFTTPEEQDRFLQVCRAHLRPGGRLWLDVFQPNLSILAQESSTDLEPHVFHVPELDRTVYKATDVRRDVAAQLQRVTFRYAWFDARGVERRAKVAFPMTFVFPRELRLLLEHNGFTVEHLYGNYDGSPLGDDSPRMIACGTRR